MAVNIKMSVKCVKCPFVTAPEEMDEHMNLCHRSTRSVTQALLRSPSLGKHKEANSSREESPKEQSENVVEKEKKRCQVCDKMLAPCSLRRHMKDVYNMSELCRCNICGKRFLTDTRLYNHSSKKHTVNIISYYECEICEYKTMNKYYLSDHTKRQHAGDDSNSFVCHMCYVRKPNSYLLKKHMQQHVESVCKVCEKQFNSTKNLKRHGKVHEGQRCKDCGMYFNGKKDLRNHKVQVHARRKSKKDDQSAAIEEAEFVLA